MVTGNTTGYSNEGTSKVRASWAGLDTAANIVALATKASMKVSKLGLDFT